MGGGKSRAIRDATDGLNAKGCRGGATIGLNYNSLSRDALIRLYINGHFGDAGIGPLPPGSEQTTSSPASLCHQWETCTDIGSTRGRSTRKTTAARRRMTTWTSDKKSPARDRHKTDTADRKKDKTQELKGMRTNDEG